MTATGDRNFGAVYVPNSTGSEPNASSIDPNEEEATHAISDTYKSAASHIMLGIPLVSVTSGIFSGVALIVLVAMLLTLVLFAPIASVAGIGWVIAMFAVRMIDLFYNFALAFVNFFAALGDSIRQRFFDRPTNNPYQPPDEKPSQPPPDEPPPTEANNENTIVASHRLTNDAVNREGNGSGPSDGQTESTQNPPIYTPDDKNWNPLFGS